jgi:hypothetical protein
MSTVTGPDLLSDMGVASGLKNSFPAERTTYHSADFKTQPARFFP